jgi:hypothetical protein
MRAWLTAAAVVAVALAGCSDDPTPGTVIDRDEFELAEGTGAIAGLLVDDRFRPIQLTDGVAATQFQARGFVLLQETGQETRTTQNGEFSFVNLDPGTYTLRANVAGHEATPQQVTVAAGVFNEASIVARRVSSTGSLILTQEKSMFTECAAEFIAVASAWLPCTLDLSLDGARTDIQANYSAFADQATAMVSEAKFNNVGDYDLAIRVLDDATGGLGATYYAECPVREGDYIRIELVVGDVDDCGGRNVEFHLRDEIQTIMFAWSATHQTFEDTAGTYGLGVVLGVRAQVIDSIFVGEPEVDLSSYCVLC